MEQKPKKLLDQVRDAVRLKHYAYRTEQSYVDWVRRYILFHPIPYCLFRTLETQLPLNHDTLIFGIFEGCDVGGLF
jgi:hypothetical protein